MKIESIEARYGPDRPATPDEIRTALALFDDVELNDGNESLLEIPSDCGGYIRIGGDEFQFLSLLEEADQLVK